MAQEPDEAPYHAVQGAAPYHAVQGAAPYHAVQGGDDYGYAGHMNPQMMRARKRAKKQLAIKATVPEGAKKVKVKAKVEMAGPRTMRYEAGKQKGT